MRVLTKKRQLEELINKRYQFRDNEEHNHLCGDLAQKLINDGIKTMKHVPCNKIISWYGRTFILVWVPIKSIREYCYDVYGIYELKGNKEVFISYWTNGHINPKVKLRRKNEYS